MAFEQASTDKPAASIYTEKDSDGYWFTRIGPIREYFGTGSPNGVVTAPIGSRCTDPTNAKLYFNTDGSTTWSAIV
jgi:hypothetical protein